jgi:hypothetical protein
VEQIKNHDTGRVIWIEKAYIEVHVLSSVHHLSSSKFIPHPFLREKGSDEFKLESTDEFSWGRNHVTRKESLVNQRWC